MTLQAFGRIRRTSFGVTCALLSISVFMPAAGARQASSGSAGQGQPATAKTSATTTSPKASDSSTSAGKTKSVSATHATTSGHRSSRRKKSARVRGQKKIDPERARTIQEALIREHYLSGEPTGTWNEASEEAMRRYQGDHGWQTKEVPDSRALISLGLGPSKDHLLNPETAMTSGPEKPPTASAATVPQNSSAPAAAPAATPSPSDPPKPQ